MDQAGAAVRQVTPVKPFLEPAKPYVFAEFPHAVRASLLWATEGIPVTACTATHDLFLCRSTRSVAGWVTHSAACLAQVPLYNGRADAHVGQQMHVCGVQCQICGQ